MVHLLGGVVVLHAAFGDASTITSIVRQKRQYLLVIRNFVPLLLYLIPSLARRTGVRRSIRGLNASCECWAESPTKLMFSYSQAVYTKPFVLMFLCLKIHTRPLVPMFSCLKYSPNPHVLMFSCLKIYTLSSCPSLSPINRNLRIRYPKCRMNHYFLPMFTN